MCLQSHVTHGAGKQVLPCEDSLYPRPLPPASSLFFTFLSFSSWPWDPPASTSKCCGWLVLLSASSSSSFFFSLFFYLIQKTGMSCFPSLSNTPPPHKPKLNVKPIYPDALEWWESIGRLGSCWNDVSPEILGLWPIKVTVWLV